MQLSTEAQTQAAEARQTDAYRVIVFNQSGTSVLLKARTFGYELPTVNIPRLTRPAQEITTLLRDRWHITSILLFSGMLEQNPDPIYFAVLEAEVRTCPAPEGLDWFPVRYAMSHLAKSGERDFLESSYLKVTNRMAIEDSEPFSRLGWLSNLQDWVRAVIRPLGMELKDFRQLNGCETFSLIRFSTNRYPVWLKAVGEPNLHEYGISQSLAQLFPQYVPKIIASNPEWHGWLMADAGGAPLNEIGILSAWQLAVETLGRLQVESIGRVDQLVYAGCRRLGITQLFNLVDPFMEGIRALMLKQTKSPPSILSQQDLHELGQTLKDALCCLAALQIPETLGHRDFNPGNIIVGPDSCVFIDWAEAHVGHPLLTFEYFLAHLRKDYPQFLPFETDFRACYSRMWSSIASPEQIADAYLLSPLVAVYAYAVSGHVWRDSERLKIPGFQGYLRSLTRRMKKEADLLQQRRVECPN
jgi:hypothetical protein